MAAMSMDRKCFLVINTNTNKHNKKRNAFSKCNYQDQKMHVKQDNENAHPWM